jgi:hypothetical protein
VTALTTENLSNMRDVFLLFAIPVGGGIPAGVLLADSRGIDWATMTALYFISDIMLALMFEPLMLGFIWLSKRYPFLAELREKVKKSTNRTISGFGASPGPFMLVVIAFGVDPMTGRAAAMANGHGFLTGWAIAILGDMFFFALIAISTLCLNNILGDGTWTAVIIMIAMLGIPALIKKFKSQK